MTQLRQKTVESMSRHLIALSQHKDKADGNKTMSRHPELYRDKEYKEALEIMSQHKTLLF